MNNKQSKSLNFDYKFDGQISWAGFNSIYGRNDYVNYARQCIPIARRLSPAQQ